MVQHGGATGSNQWFNPELKFMSDVHELDKFMSHVLSWGFPSSPQASAMFYNASTWTGDSNCPEVSMCTVCSNLISNVLGMGSRSIMTLSRIKQPLRNKE